MPICPFCGYEGKKRKKENCPSCGQRLYVMKTKNGTCWVGEEPTASSVLALFEEMYSRKKLVNFKFLYPERIRELAMAKTLITKAGNKRIAELVVTNAFERGCPDSFSQILYRLSTYLASAKARYENETEEKEKEKYKAEKAKSDFGGMYAI